LALKTWKDKVKIIAGAVSLPAGTPFYFLMPLQLDVPFRLFAATAKDQFRKPMPGMWEGLEAMFAAGGVTIGESGLTVSYHFSHAVQIDPSRSS
jgi:bifunctional polynucleotide phosphatase/kinase